MMRFLLERDTWQELYDSIRKNKFRTVVTMIGVWWGILLLVTLLGSARGFENFFDKQFGDFATNSVFIWGDYTGKPFKGFQEGKRVELTQDDTESIKKEIPGLEFVIPRNMNYGTVTQGFQSGTFGIMGDYPVLDKVQKKDMIYGRFLNQVDIDDNRKVTVISEDVYKQLFEKDVNPIGEYLLINDINFKVIGMFKDQRSGGPRSDIHIPFTTFRQVYNMGNKIGWMMITGKPAYDIGQIELDATLLLKNIHKIHPNDTKAFGSFNLGKRFKELTGFLIGMQFLTWFVGIATLIAGVFAIGNILLITVKERTKEIGVRRALGATPFEIKRQVVLEALALTIISGLLGIISGGLILMLIDAQQSTAETPFLVNPSVSIPIVFLAVIILVVLGTLIGLIPANKATSIKPIDALREE
jgi:putative ABC transport system permease protein